MKLPYPCPKCGAPIHNYGGVCMACGHNSCVTSKGTEMPKANQEQIEGMIVCEIEHRAGDVATISRIILSADQANTDSIAMAFAALRKHTIEANENR